MPRRLCSFSATKPNLSVADSAPVCPLDLGSLTARMAALAQLLITGGAGFIGSHTCLVLLEAGHNLVVLDNFSNSSPEALRGWLNWLR
jgi:hypothetical protein